MLITSGRDHRRPQNRALAVKVVESERFSAMIETARADA
jgi:hypothetical protein